MKTAHTTSAADVEVVPATAEQEPVIANLFELYSHDFSEFFELTLGPDGRFGSQHLHLYWEEPGRHPFIIRAGGRLAGFAFVRRGSEVSGDAGVWDVAEFFVARGFRRLGVGTRAARGIWAMFPGRWEVRVMNRNRKALKFWRRAVGEFLGREVEPTVHAKEGQAWHVYSFETGRAA
jgi:predicted acetyltransferase